MSTLKRKAAQANVSKWSMGFMVKLVVAAAVFGTILNSAILMTVVVKNNDNNSSAQHHAPSQQDSYLSKKYDVCIVGAGLSGSVLAERYSSELKASVLVLEKRDHIGGNCYDFIDPDTGLRVSKYGAHLFHTKHELVKDYVTHFGKWTPYEHKVRGIVNGKNVPIPVNIETVNTLFDLNIQTSQEMDEWLQKEQVPLVNGQATDSEQVALSRVGQRLYDLIFKPYTFKQWAKYPKQLGPEVMARIPVRNDKDERYFSDAFQALPQRGYTSIFQQMLSSPLITVKLNVDFFKVKDQMKCDRIYFSGKIDSYFADTGWPKLEYRSLDFERVVTTNLGEGETFQSNFVVNHPQDDKDFTRIVEYKHLPNQPPSNHTIYFLERSKDGGEPYYPVPTKRNKDLYLKYQALATKETDVKFVGRLASYKYFDMDAAIKNALELFETDTGIAYEVGGTVLGETKLGLKGGTHVVENHLISYAQTLHATYSNQPPVEMTEELQDKVDKALALPIGLPVGLRHQAYPPGNNAVTGLAAYPKNMDTFRLLVGSLRNAGYDGHIILGVSALIPPEEESYLKKMDVTYYIVDFVDCDASIMDAGEFDGAIRGKCSKGLEKLKLEWGRFEMCRQWLHLCKECTGWSLVMDTRDIFFQSDPFAGLPPAESAEQDLLLIEEIAPHSNPRPDTPHRADILGDNYRYAGNTEPCYGKMHQLPFYNRPVLCSGTIIGTRSGIHRFLSVLVDEFLQNNAKSNHKCRSPHTTDQWTMNYLYYTGRFGDFIRTKTLPYGTGPVNTIGTPCVDRKLKGAENHSRKDLVLFDDNNMIVNIHEPEDSKFRVAPAVHQYDRCHKWIRPWLGEHPELRQKREDNKYIPIDKLSLPWSKSKPARALVQLSPAEDEGAHNE